MRSRQELLISTMLLMNERQKTEATIAKRKTVTKKPILPAFNAAQKLSKVEREINAKELVQQYWQGLMQKDIPFETLKKIEGQIKAIKQYDATHKTNYSVILNGLMHHTDDKSRHQLQQWVIKESPTTPDKTTKPANSGSR